MFCSFLRCFRLVVGCCCVILCVLFSTMRYSAMLMSCLFGQILYEAGDHCRVVPSSQWDIIASKREDLLWHGICARIFRYREQIERLLCCSSFNRIFFETFTFIKHAKIRPQPAAKDSTFFQSCSNLFCMHQAMRLYCMKTLCCSL